MASKNLIMNLAKLIIATAWVDGQVKASEVNVLKSLIHSWGDISEEEWTTLDAYIDAPVHEAERERLLAGLVDSIASAADKRLVVDTLTRLVEADGEVTPEEEKTLDQIRQAVESKGTGLGAFLSSLVGSAMKRQSDGAGSVRREERLDDFVHNSIYFQLVSEMEAQQIRIDLPEGEVRKLCLCAGLLAKVAQFDSGIEEEEGQAICQVLEERWSLSRQAAQLVCQVSLDRLNRDLDYFHLARTLFQVTTYEERRWLLFDMFRVANAADKTSFEEIEGIRQLSRSLKLHHQDFIEAKLSISKQDRSGL